MSQNTTTQVARFQFKVDTASNWTKHNPRLLKNEFGFEYDPNNETKNCKFKIGDGVNSWNDLKYSNQDIPIATPFSGELVPVSLLGITTGTNTDDSGNESYDISLTENSIGGYSASAFVNFQGYAEIEVMVSHHGSIKIDNNETVFLDASSLTSSYSFKGYIHNGINISAQIGSLTFKTFLTTAEKGQAGLISPIDKYKLNNIYYDKNNNVGFGNIDTLDFYASNGFGTGTNNIIGSKAFNILAMDATNHTLTLDSVEGLEVGDIFTIKFKTNYNDMAKITAINENIITTSALSKEELSNLPNPNGRTFDDIWTDSLVLENGEVVFGTDVNSLRINAKPQCGTKFFGTDSFVEGCGNIATGDCAHAEGYSTQALGRYAHAEGLSTIAYYGAHSEGKDTKAIGDMAHAEGQNSKAVNLASHAEGSDTLSSGGQAHAEGWKSKATGPKSHAEGQKTEATGLAAHAEGDSTVAGGNAAHAEGFNTQALGGFSHAEGWGTIAHKDINAQHVQGRWNKPLAFPYVHIVGYGTGDTDRKNIHTLDKDGNAWFAGDVTVTTSSGEIKLGESMGDISAALDNIIAIQNALVGGAE